MWDWVWGVGGGGGNPGQNFPRCNLTRRRGRRGWGLTNHHNCPNHHALDPYLCGWAWRGSPSLRICPGALCSCKGLEDKVVSRQCAMRGTRRINRNVSAQYVGPERSFGTSVYNARDQNDQSERQCSMRGTKIDPSGHQCTMCGTKMMYRTILTYGVLPLSLPRISPGTLNSCPLK
jgi:hypothetical protein